MLYKILFTLEFLVSLFFHPFQNMKDLYNHWYFENTNISVHYTINQKNVFEQGFCIKGNLTNSFIKKMLIKLNVSNKESQAFMKQLPQDLASHSYNLIYFDTNTTSALTIIFKPVNTYISLPRQELMHLSNNEYKTVNYINITF